MHRLNHDFALEFRHGSLRSFAMFACKCMYTCICVRESVCMLMCMDVYVYVNGQGCVCVCVCVCMLMRMEAHVYASMHALYGEGVKPVVGVCRWGCRAAKTRCRCCIFSWPSRKRLPSISKSAPALSIHRLPSMIPASSRCTHSALLSPL